MTLKGKRFLVTQYSISAIAGGEVFTYELATYLMSKGAEVTVYTWNYLNPMRDFFEKKGINVIEDNSGTAMLSSDDYDYVWVNQQVIPKSILDDIFIEKKSKPFFLFSHMSALDYVPLDKPYIWDIERILADKTIYISEEIDNFLSDQYLSTSSSLFKNPAPIEFSESDSRIKNTLDSILVVSNHPPNELIEAMHILESRGVRVVTLGEAFGGKKSLITAELLNNFDAVITIGKTVQYCLCMGVPVYIYDHFGGEGYLNDDNFIRAEKYNFSGRTRDSNGTIVRHEKTPEQIVDSVLDGYSDALTFQQKKRKKFIDDYSIHKVFPRTIKGLDRRPVEAIDDTYLNYLTTAYDMVRSYTVEINKTYIERVKTLEARIKLEVSELVKLRGQRNSRDEEDYGIKRSAGLLKSAIVKKIRKSIKG